jgi:hypothetical protein
MNISQPTLSRGIAALERALGVPLFDRTRKGALSTVFGRVLLERGEFMLRDDYSLPCDNCFISSLKSSVADFCTGGKSTSDWMCSLSSS